MFLSAVSAIALFQSVAAGPVLHVTTEEGTLDCVGVLTMTPTSAKAWDLQGRPLPDLAEMCVNELKHRTITYRSSGNLSDRFLLIKRGERSAPPMPVDENWEKIELSTSQVIGYRIPLLRSAKSSTLMIEYGQTETILDNFPFRVGEITTRNGKSIQIGKWGSAEVLANRHDPSWLIPMRGVYGQMVAFDGEGARIDHVNPFGLPDGRSRIKAEFYHVNQFSDVHIYESSVNPSKISRFELVDRKHRHWQLGPFPMNPKEGRS